MMQQRIKYVILEKPNETKFLLTKGENQIADVSTEIFAKEMEHRYNNYEVLVNALKTATEEIEFWERGMGVPYRQETLPRLRNILSNLNQSV